MVSYVFEIRKPKAGEWIWDCNTRLFSLCIKDMNTVEHVLVAAYRNEQTKLHPHIIDASLGSFIELVLAKKKKLHQDYLDKYLSPKLGEPF